MSVNANGYWMDRLKATPEAQERTHESVVPITVELTLHRIDTARAALRDRTGITQQQLLGLARERRRALLAASRPGRVLLAVALIAAGIALAIAGNLLTQQLLLLSGLGTGLIGLVLGCALLAELMGPQTGDLARHLQDREIPASVDEIAWLARATRGDAELRHLTLGWWKDSEVPIRKQDLELVLEFQEAKAER